MREVDGIVVPDGMVALRCRVLGRLEMPRFFDGLNAVLAFRVRRGSPVAAELVEASIDGSCTGADSTCYFALVKGGVREELDWDVGFHAKPLFIPVVG